MDLALFLWIVGLAISVTVGVVAYRRQRTRSHREVPGALGFALLAGVFAIPTLLWWAIAGKSFTAGRANPR